MRGGGNIGLDTSGHNNYCVLSPGTETSDRSLVISTERVTKSSIPKAPQIGGPQYISWPYNRTVRKNHQCICVWQEIGQGP